MRIGGMILCDASGQGVREDMAIKIGDNLYHPDFVPQCRRCGATPTKETEEEFGIYDGVVFHNVCANPFTGGETQ
jgi:hypothetical protein